MQQKCHLLEQQACFPSSESDQWNRKVRWTQGKSQIAPLCPKRYSRLSFLNARIWYKLKASVCSHTKNIGFKIHGKPQKYWDGIYSVHFGVTRKDSHSLYCYCWQSETAPCFGGGVWKQHVPCNVVAHLLIPTSSPHPPAIFWCNSAHFNFTVHMILWIK